MQIIMNICYGRNGILKRDTFIYDLGSGEVSSEVADPVVDYILENELYKRHFNRHTKFTGHTLSGHSYTIYCATTYSQKEVEDNWRASNDPYYTGANPKEEPDYLLLLTQNG